jgi:hypothetical protein
LTPHFVAKGRETEQNLDATPMRVGDEVAAEILLRVRVILGHCHVMGNFLERNAPPIHKMTVFPPSSATPSRISRHTGSPNVGMRMKQR